MEAFSQRMADHGIVTLTSGGEAVHLDRKLDDADNYSEMVTRLAKDYIDWWMLSKARVGYLPLRSGVMMQGRVAARPDLTGCCSALELCPLSGPNSNGARSPSG